MTEVFSILADSTRRKIVEALSQKERSVNEIVDLVNIQQSGVSRHLKILNKANFVQVKKDGQRRIYTLKTEPFQELDDWLNTYYRSIWEKRFDKLEDNILKNDNEV